MFEIFLDLMDHLISFEGVVFRNAFDLDLSQSDDVILVDVTHQPQPFIVGHRFHAGCDDVFLQFFIDGLDHFFERLTFFYFTVNAVLNEDLFQTGQVPFFFEFSLFDLQFPAQEFFGIFCRDAQHFFDSKKMRLVVDNDTGIWRNANLTIGKGIQCTNSYIR